MHPLPFDSTSPNFSFTVATRLVFYFFLSLSCFYTFPSPIFLILTLVTQPSLQYPLAAPSLKDQRKDSVSVLATQWVSEPKRHTNRHTISIHWSNGKQEEEEARGREEKKNQKEKRGEEVNIFPFSVIHIGFLFWLNFENSCCWSKMFFFFVFFCFHL